MDDDNSGPNDTAAPVQSILGVNVGAAGSALGSGFSSGFSSGLDLTSAGSSFTSGVESQLTPLLPYILLGVGAIVIALALGGR